MRWYSVWFENAVGMQLFLEISLYEMASARNSVSPTTDYKFLTQAQLEKVGHCVDDACDE